MEDDLTLYYAVIRFCAEYGEEIELPAFGQIFRSEMSL